MAKQIIMKPKEIFFCLFPDGYMENPLYGALHHHPNEQRYFVVCNGPKCMGKRHRTCSDSKTAYGNAVSHATSCYGGEVQLLDFIQRSSIDEKSAKNGGGGIKTKTQQDIFAAFKLNKPTGHELALHQWMKLVCLHNVLITKMMEPDFCEIICKKCISYGVFIDTMIELSMIVEEKIAAEMKGTRGTIIHNDDGSSWSKFSRHYVCLLAHYMVESGKRDSNGGMLMEPVMTLLTCTTLPHDDSLGERATKFNADTRTKLFEQTFANLKINNINDFAIAQISVSNPYYDSDELFIRALNKVQQGREDTLTIEEALVIEPWKLDQQESGENMPDVEKREQKLKIMKSDGVVKSAYNLALQSCVLGSVAAAERVWDMADEVLKDQRSSMSPLVCELIMYLKYNNRLWSIADVVEANRRRQNESPAAKNRLAVQKERLQGMKTEVIGWNPAGHGEFVGFP